MIDEEWVNFALHELTKYEHGIQFINQILSHSDDPDICKALTHVLHRKQSKCKTIQTLLCEEYEKSENH